jgi:hypothetical protein
MMASTKYCATRRFRFAQSEQMDEEYLIPSPLVLSRRERKDFLSVPFTTGTGKETASNPPSWRPFVLLAA